MSTTTNGARRRARSPVNLSSLLNENQGNRNRSPVDLGPSLMNRSPGPSISIVNGRQNRAFRDYEGLLKDDVMAPPCDLTTFATSTNCPARATSCPVETKGSSTYNAWQQESRCGRGKIDCTEEDPFNDEILRIVAERSHGLTPDEQTKIRELQRKNEFSSDPEHTPAIASTRTQSAPYPTPSTVSSRASLQGNTNANVSSINESSLLGDDEMHQILVLRSHGLAGDDEIKMRELERMKDAAEEQPHTTAVSQKSPSPRAAKKQDDSVQDTPPVRDNKNQDEPVQEEEEDPLIQVVAERASAALAEELQFQKDDEDCKLKAPYRDCKSDGQGVKGDVDLLQVAAWRSQQSDSNEPTNTTRAPAPSMESQVEYSATGQVMAKNKLPPGAKRPGAYSGAPGAGYNRLQSFRLTPAVQSNSACNEVSQPHSASTINTTEVGTESTAEDPSPAVLQTPSVSTNTCAPVADTKKKKKKKGAFKQFFKLVRGTASRGEKKHAAANVQ